MLQMLSADHLHLVMFLAMESGWRMPKGTFLVLSQRRPAASRCPIDAGTASLPSPKCSEHAVCAQALLSRALMVPDAYSHCLMLISLFSPLVAGSVGKSCDQRLAPRQDSHG